MRARIEQELALLRRQYPDVQHQEHAGADWFLLPRYPFPPGWCVNNEAIRQAPVCFRIVATYPTGEPYGFCGPAGINFKGKSPGNPGSPVDPPFEGGWQHFSWAPEDWAPTGDALKGSNLVVWVRSFGIRLREGA